MGCNQSNEADRASKGDCGCRQQDGKTQQKQMYARYIDPEACCLLSAEQQHVKRPCGEQQGR